MAKIKKIKGFEILDSRGNPTVEAEVTLDNDISDLASVPSGISTGSKEAVELRDNDSRYGGMGVQKAVSNIDKEIFPVLSGIDVEEQEKIDKTLVELDGTPHKSKLGANAILAVSLAVCKAAAKSLKMPLYGYINQILGKEFKMSLPVPTFNIINGGKHADNKLPFQEFMVVTTNPSTFAEKLREGTEIYHRLKKVLSEHSLSTAVGDEGGFAPQISQNEEAMDLLLKAGAKNIALDIAGAGPTELNYYVELIKKYPVVIIEDPLMEDDWDGWQKLTQTLDGKTLIVGDDIFVTNPDIFKKGIEQKIGNAILVKPNQIGTLSETLEVIKMAKDSNYVTIISHRSGETEDTFISDLSVAVGAKYIKTGAPSRGERVAKYNRLLRIEQELS